MLRGRHSARVVLLSFLAGGLAVGSLVLCWQASLPADPLLAAARADSGQPMPPGTPPSPWLKGTTEQRLAQIERQLRGLDLAMAEIGYRYGELLCAGKTRNWDYARYQTEKIDLSLRLALERRPKRLKSSEPFLNETLPELMRAIQAKDGTSLDGALAKLHDGCVQCHKAEDVLYFKESVDRIKERALAAPPPGQAKPSAAPAMLTEATELQKSLTRPGLRILDTRPKAEHAKAHIPGAVWVDVKSWQEQGKKEGGFRDAKGWGELVARLGIDHDSNVVVYGGPITEAARIWWTLKYLGLENVSILNGGWQRWSKDQLPTHADIPKVAAGKFEPKFQADRLVEIDSLKKAVGSNQVTVVDARSADEFTGKDVRGKRGGHIPGSKHLEWKELLAEDGRFKSPEQLRALFRQRGILPEQTAVTC